jgi:hypothetical protein
MAAFIAFPIVGLQLINKDLFPLLRPYVLASQAVFSEVFGFAQTPESKARVEACMAAEASRAADPRRANVFDVARRSAREE